jgi:hypothetical protein
LSYPAQWVIGSKVMKRQKWWNHDVLLPSGMKEVFKILAPCSLVENYWCFRGTCWLSLQDRMKIASFSETSVNFYQTVWCHASEDSYLQGKYRPISISVLLRNLLHSVEGQDELGGMWKEAVVA